MWQSGMPPSGGSLAARCSPRATGLLFSSFSGVVVVVGLVVVGLVVVAGFRSLDTRNEIFTSVIC